MKDFGTTKRPENNADDPAAKYRKEVKLISRRAGPSNKDEAIIRLIGGIQLSAMYWFKSISGKRFAITTPFFDEDNESFIPNKCPVYDRSLAYGALTWAMNAINRYKQQTERIPNPVEVFPANKTEFGQIMDLHAEHGAPNSIAKGYDIITRKWKESGVPKCTIAIKMNMEGGSYTPLNEIEASYPLWDLELLYQPKAVGDYILDVIKACLLSPEIGGAGKYTPDDFKRDYAKYMPQDEQQKHARAYTGILKRYHDHYLGGGSDNEDADQVDSRAPAMMPPGAGVPADISAHAPMAHTPMSTLTQQLQTSAPAVSAPAPVPPAQLSTSAVTPAPVPSALTATAPSAPPAAGSYLSGQPTRPEPTSGTAPSSAPMPPPTAVNTASSPPMAPPSAGSLNIPTAVNSAYPPPGMPDPNQVMNHLAPAPIGSLGTIDD